MSYSIFTNNETHMVKNDVMRVKSETSCVLYWGTVFVFDVTLIRDPAAHLDMDGILNPDFVTSF